MSDDINRFLLFKLPSRVGVLVAVLVVAELVLSMVLEGVDAGRGGGGGGLDEERRGGFDLFKGQKLKFIQIQYFLFHFVFFLFPTFGGNKTSDIWIADIACWARADGVSGPVEGAVCIDAARVRGEAGVEEGLGDFDCI